MRFQENFCPAKLKSDDGFTSELRTSPKLSIRVRDMSISLTVDRKSSSKGFTRVPNHIINDPNLSLKAKGLISSLLSLPPGYHPSVEGLAKKHGTGTSAIRSGLQELRDAGYLKVDKKYDVSRQFAGYEWRLSDHPEGLEVPDYYREKPYAENPHVDSPASEDTKLINTNKTKKPKNKNTTTPPPQLPGLAEQGLRINAPMLTETRDQIMKALEHVAPTDRQRMLDELSAAIKSGAIKTTAIRWFHGVIKRYREGTYNFRPEAPQPILEACSQTPPGALQEPTQIGPPSVTANERSNVGLEHLSKLKKNRCSSNSSSASHLTNEGHVSDQDQ